MRKINAGIAALLVVMLFVFNLPEKSYPQKLDNVILQANEEKQLMVYPTVKQAEAKKAKAVQSVSAVSEKQLPAAQKKQLPAAPEKQLPAAPKKQQSALPETEEVIAPGAYPIMGRASATAEQMVKFYEAQGVAYPSASLEPGGAGSIQTFCQLYIEECTAEGVRPEVAFIQTMKETGWLQYGGDSHIEQYNFAGLGTTGGGVAGNAYPDVRTGIRAQVQHLKAYATDQPLNQACVDSRYEYVSKGCAPYVEWLGQSENPQGYGWATAEQYGYSIVDMIQKLKGI